MEAKQPIIELNDVTMQFNLSKEKVETAKEYVVKLLSGKLHFDEFNALKHLSLTIDRGDSIALIGANGSGKSTTLKLISGIYTPTSGTVKIHGTVAPLIELGAGFDFELTARENIFLNGAVLGYDREFMQSHFNEIMDFAELWDFVDVPVKNFSSGMQARLGFSIATIVSADILIVDEILAVGDIAFQRKCHEKMAAMLANGTTLVLVSHNMNDVERLCKKVAWLDHGELRELGPAEEVCPHYMKAMNAEEE
jgi:ABC-type polysaccharide/polyol phosphate transport system ATPase subunit